jgi:hypothetical protein
MEAISKTAAAPTPTAPECVIKWRLAARLYRISDSGPTPEEADTARENEIALYLSRAVGDSGANASNRCTAYLSEQSDADIAAAVAPVRILARYERSCYATSLHNAVVYGHDTYSAGKDARGARLALALILNDAQRRIDRYRKAANALAKAMR